ncbi:MAG: 4Fe-4S binding protein [Bacteroidales bacterium]|nr:4Fe-4S binding protein [Bacteroidales bacterium]
MHRRPVRTAANAVRNLFIIQRYLQFSYRNILIIQIKWSKFALTNKKEKKMAYKISADTCVACGTCQGECPSGAISEGDVYTIDPNVCVDCGACADACPMGAIAPGE